MNKTLKAILVVSVLAAVTAKIFIECKKVTR